MVVGLAVFAAVLTGAIPALGAIGAAIAVIGGGVAVGIGGHHLKYVPKTTLATKEFEKTLPATLENITKSKSE